MSTFTVSCTSDKIWNYSSLLDFLIANQHNSINLNIEPEAICLKNIGLYDLLDKFIFEQVTINTSNPLESHSKYKIVSNNFTRWLKQTETIDTTLHTWNLNKIFYCLFGRPTASRLGLAGYLLTQYPKISHLHFSASTNNDELVHYELDKLLTYQTASIKDAGNLINQLPLLLSGAENYTKYNGYYYNDPLTKLYQDIFVDILAESHVAGNTFFPTEKTARPMWLKKPFIIFASKNYLEYLRQLGFRTFSDFWNEEYDGYDGRDRFVKIIELIDYLANKSTDELEKIYWDMQYTLDHNYNLLVTQTYKTNITYIE